MHELRRRFLLNALKLYDLALVVLSFGIATILVAHADKRVSLAEFFSMRVKLSNCLIFGLFLFAWHGILYSCGLYRSRRLSTRQAEIQDAFRAVMMATACLALGAALCSVKMVTPRFIVFFWAVATTLVTVSRMILRESLGQIRLHGHNLRYVLVVGTNPRAIKYAQRIADAPERGYRILGFVDDDWPMMDEFLVSGFSAAVRSRWSCRNSFAATWLMKWRCICRFVHFTNTRFRSRRCASSTAS